jgi:hypothetical protein
MGTRFGTRLRYTGLLALLLGLASACAPADPVLDAAEAGAVAQAEATAPAADPDAIPADKEAPPGEIDFSCRSDADCAVKNVGNCCGYYPACVNEGSPTFPEKVMAQCQREGLSSICGFPEISACQCVEGRCEAADSEGTLD